MCITEPGRMGPRSSMRRAQVEASKLRAASAGDPHAVREVTQHIVRATQGELLKLAPWRCGGCGAAAAGFVNNPAVDLQREPPLVFDLAMPKCAKAACEKAVRAEAAEVARGGGLEAAQRQWGLRTL